MKRKIFFVGMILIGLAGMTGCSSKNTLKCHPQDNKYELSYSFKEGKVDQITHIFYLTDDLSKPAYDNEVQRFKETIGCTANLQETNENKLKYIVTETCVLSEMSAKEVEALYGNTKEQLQRTYKDLKKTYEEAGFICE